QSPLPGSLQAPAGTVTEAPPSLESIVVSSVALVPPVTGGGSDGEPLETVKSSRKAPVLPARSRSLPRRVCAPSPTGPGAKSTCLPLTTGVTVGAPSRVTPLTPARSSLATREIAFAEPTVVLSAGVDDASDGAVLSIRMPARTLAREFPSLSYA